MRTRKDAKPWTMPVWMEPYRSILADYGLGVEDLMNDQDSTFYNNEYRAALCVSIKNQVALLERLKLKGLLSATPVHLTREG